MGLADFLSTPFLISLGITFLLVGILGIFLSQKIMEQNHKISSMFGLVTTMADELNFLRSRLTAPVMQQVFKHEIVNEPLISVSDDDDEESEDEVDEESEEDDESEDEDEDELEEDKLVFGEEVPLLEETDGSNIKVIQMGETLNFEEQSNNQEEEESEDLEEEDFDDESEASESLEEEEISSGEKVSSVEKVSSADLKKMTIQTLKETAIKLGYSGDVSKIKKPDLLKLVEGLL